MKLVSELGWWEPKNIFLLLCLYKASVHSWKRAASGEEQGLSMAQPVLVAPPVSKHPLPPFHYKQAGARLAVSWLLPIFLANIKDISEETKHFRFSSSFFFLVFLCLHTEQNKNFI